MDLGNAGPLPSQSPMVMQPNPLFDQTTQSAGAAAANVGTSFALTAVVVAMSFISSM